HAYRAGVEAAVQRTGASLPAGAGTAALLVVGGELGLCGGYHRDLVAEAAARRAALGPGPTYVVGRRAQAILRRAGVEVARSYPAPTSPRGLVKLLLSLAQDTLTDYVRDDHASLDVVAARFEGVGAFTAATTRLLPFVGSGAPATPPRYVSAEHLRRVAVREALYITLHGVLLDALAAEHGARLVATQAAEDWLQRRRQTLERGLGAARREASTQEVIEIVAGARARAR
ncbi:MAG: F0F1 ATP synthase subunit gamma, partial [Myxococcales bacterium]|nr:F0F1 ATP synthase subunit gamma [Myxococcales bacterium]